MADIVQQGRRQNRVTLLVRYTVFRLKFIEDAVGQVKRAEAVGKARMFGALISEKTDAKLPDTAKPLKFGSIDQSNKQLSASGIGRKTYYVVNRIPVYFFDVSAPSFL